MSVSTEDLRTLLRDQSISMTNVLEASQAQSREFQSILLSYAREMAQHASAGLTAAAAADFSTTARVQPTVQIIEKDPHFPEWNGDRTGLLQWLYQV